MKKGTRRGVLLLASMLVMLAVVGGIAWAVTKIGDDGPNTLTGTSGRDTLRGLGGNDNLNGQRGADRISGGPGRDRLVEGGLRSDKSVDYLAGGGGNDILITRNKLPSRDNVRCGPGFDRWTADRADRYYGSRCERVRVP
jgi:Ca2+-binding RTX toxin-like protein